MKNIASLVLALCYGLAGCATQGTSNEAIETFKPEPNRSQKELWSLMAGKWFGRQPTTENGHREWIVVRQSDGHYLITFRVYDTAGKYEEQTEVGEWGVSGSIYFTIFKGWIEDGFFTPADKKDPYNRDAYRIIELTSQHFTYESVESAHRFTVKRVSDDYWF